MYVLIELLESKTNLKNANQFGGKLGPLIGSATGLIPQCGFSVMASKLYEQKYITLGTLLAIFMATSDEAFIILLSSGEGAKWVLPTLAVKIAVGVAVGYGVDAFMRVVGKKQTCVAMPERTASGTPTTVHEIFIAQYEAERDVDVVCSCGRNHGDNTPWKRYFLYPVWHTLKVAFFIFIVNFVFTAIVHTVGEAKFASFMERSKFLQPLITCGIGLIPNCASSVVITEAFLSGGIAFGSFVAGLCANAGMGFMVLLRNLREWKRNLTLIAFCYTVAVLVGIIINLV
jgi:hypothetical protein